MDQNELRQWERRCIQEEPPACTAACPIHVDVRSFVGHLQKGRWDQGWQTLARTMPLAGLVGRICDGPCEARCKRGEAGDAIRIAALEQACVRLARSEYRVTRLPGRPKRIAVLGSGLSSLTVAWDLVRKGYGVTLFEPGDVPGAVLCDAHPVLTPAIVAAELASLETLGVAFETGTAVHGQAFLEDRRDRFDAFYIGLDAVASLQWPLDRGAGGEVRIDTGTQATSRPEVFAGGDVLSTIWRVAQGRWAATSIDRFLQNVSMTAGREREGPYDTRLYTSLTDVVPQPAVPMADAKAGYSESEAMAEAARCLICQCLECVKVCPYLENFGAYPRKYVREIYNNESIVMGSRSANLLINSCSLCGLCEAVCPEDFAMQDLCLQARRSMVQRGKMPPTAHEFALEDMAFSLGEDFFLARHAPGAGESSHLFFPGCQLSASAPGQVEALYAHLNHALGGRVGLMLACCGAPAFWAGREADFDRALAQWQHHWEALGRPKLIVACATCHVVFQDHRPEVPVQSVWETLAEVGLPPIDTDSAAGPLAIHDPCTTREMPHVQVAVRRLLDQLGISIAELPLSGEKTECCGFGGLMQNANPDLAREVIRRRADLSGYDYVAYCAMCRDSLAAVGKRTLHLLDLIFPDRRIPDPATRPRPGWSARREHRARLRTDLLDRWWGETPSGGPDYRALVLRMAPDVRETLDARHILVEDVQQVIARAEAGGPKFRHPGTGRVKAAGRPRHVTFWVEYAPCEAGFEVFNAYSHRMEVHGP